MDLALNFLILHGFMGGFDILWYHEWKERLAARPSAWRELRLHAMRAAVFLMLFIGLAWFQWRGLWAWMLMALACSEVFITAWDAIEEDETRKLPAGERAMHTFMILNYGVFLAFLLPQALSWSQQATQVELIQHGWKSWVMSALGLGVLVSGMRDGIASHHLKREFKNKPA